MQPANNDRQRRHRSQTSKAMRQMAVAKTCPQCRRMNAVSHHADALGSDRWCRYCDWTKHTAFQTYNAEIQRRRSRPLESLVVRQRTEGEA